MVNITIRPAKKVNGEWGAFITFPYDYSLVENIRSLSTKYWNADAKEWEIPVNKLNTFLDKCKGHKIALNCPDIEILGDEPKVAKIPQGFEFKTKPFKHQVEGFEYGLTHDRWLLSDEQGCVSGNSLVCIKEQGSKATRKTKIENLKRLFEKDNTIQIKSMINGRFGYMPIKAVIDKGVQKTIKITLEDTSIECTPDHLIYTEKGWIEAGELSIGDNVFTNGIQACELCGSTENIITYPYSKFNGYCKHCMYNWLRSDRQPKELIKKVDRWGYVRLIGKPTKNMPNYSKLVRHGGIYEHHQVWYENTGHIVDTSKEAVHHINGIKTDNRFENLQLMTIEEHCILHSDTNKKSLYQFNTNLDYVMRKGTKIFLVPHLQTVTKIEESKEQRVWDIAIDDAEIHNFICNNIVVHNCGKTKELIDCAIAQKLIHNYKHCLIICGVNGLKWNWQNEIRVHSNEEGWILGQRQKKNKLVIGSSADKLADLNKIDELPYFIITNVETLRQSDIVDKLKKLCDDEIIGVIAIDEGHKVKDSTSQQGKGILKLKAPYMVVMTGTPLMNNPMDLYTIFRWLGYEKHSLNAFKNHYCVMGGYGGYQIVGYKNLGELQEQLNEIMLRRLKEDVLDLPEKTYIDEYVDMTAKQSKVYKEVSDEIKENIDKIKTAPNPLSEMIRMRQATGYPGILSSTITESAKLDRMEELVAESVANGRKVVIFSNWTQITDEVQRRLKNYNCAIITGDTKDADRQAMVERFQDDNRCKALVGTIGAAGTGLTLTAGTVVIFLDHPWNRALYDQAVDRCHRIGQKNNITIYNLLCKNTIDERIWELVKEKGDMSDALVDGKVASSKGSMVDYLLS